MASRFIPPSDQINNIAPKKAKKSFSDDSGQSIFHELKRNIRESYAADAFAQVGQMNAVVLEVIQPDVTKMVWRSPLMSYMYEEKGTIPDYIEIRFRIPEMHAHLPVPEGPDDFKAINVHPKAIMKKDKGMPQPGDIVTLDFQDKNNFRGAYVIETLNTQEGASPNGGGNCSPAGTFNSAAPPLNMSTPAGDGQESSQEEYSALNQPSQQGRQDGINYPVTPEQLAAKDVFKKNCYLITPDEFNTLSDFRNLDSVALSIVGKNIAAICFIVADNDKKIRDVEKFRKIINLLARSNVDVGLAIRQSSNLLFHDNFIFMAEIAKSSRVKFVIHYLQGTVDTDADDRQDNVFRNFSNSLGVQYYAMISETQVPSPTIPERADRVYAAQNNYDFANRAAPKRDAVPDSYPFYYMDGINFIYTPDEPCIAGQRTKSIMSRNIQSSTSAEKYYNIFTGFTNLNAEIAEAIAEKTSVSLSDDEKQSFLSSSENIQTTDKTKVDNIEGTEAEQSISAPSFNDDSADAQSATAAESSGFSSTPGAQCSSIPGGGAPFPAAGAGAVSAPTPPAPPSFRFDSIENYESLGWTAGSHHIINDVIFDFMQRFSAAVYRRLPLNSPSFTGSVPKKIKLTSTARTFEKQAELMWDKIKNGGGDSAVYSLYGDKEWTRGVVNAYHANRFDLAVQAVADRVAAGGGSAHLKGRGVDVHTWSHLDAEGITSSNASIATMESSRFVAAIVEAAIECNARPTVEAYQQHVHITIL